MGRIALVTLVIFLFLENNSKAQSLSFSRVLILHATEDTVPAGKVWKIESFMQKDAGIGSGSSTNCLSSNVHPVVINGSNFYLMKDLTTGYSAWGVLPDQQLPIWLPAGQTVKTYCADDFLSVIEFTITP